MATFVLLINKSFSFKYNVCLIYDLTVVITINRPICPITIEEIQSPAALPCGHVFEQHALLQWLQIKRDCPTCRRDVDPIEPNVQPMRSYTVVDLEAQAYRLIENKCSATCLTAAVGVAFFVTTIYFQNFF